MKTRCLSKIILILICFIYSGNAVYADPKVANSVGPNDYLMGKQEGYNLGLNAGLKERTSTLIKEANISNETKTIICQIDQSQIPEPSYIPEKSEQYQKGYRDGWNEGYRKGYEYGMEGGNEGYILGLILGVFGVIIAYII